MQNLEYFPMNSFQLTKLWKIGYAKIKGFLGEKLGVV